MTILQQIQLILKKLDILKRLKELLLMQEQKGFSNFAYDLGKRESNNDYKARNTLGYLGRWQFGRARLTDLGLCERIPGTTGFGNDKFRWLTGYSERYFLNTPDLQNRVFRQHIDNLVRQVQNKFSDYLDKKVNNITITLSGLVAGAHLGGIGGVQIFLETGQEPSDAYGTSVADYVKKFEGYNLT